MLVAGHRLVAYRRPAHFSELGVTGRDGSRVHERWAQLRFSVIGQLLAAPPAKGALRAALRQLAAREWRHPSTGAPIRFGVSTLERWFYRARNERHDPVRVLRRKRRQDAGDQGSMTVPLRQALLAQYDAHKSWSAQLHHDNLAALAETSSELRPVPSYATVRRFLAARGLIRRRTMTTRQTTGALAAAARLEAREVRSYEAAYVKRTLALGLPPRFAQGADDARRMADADPVRRA